MASSRPITPDHNPSAPIPSVRRSFTAPIRSGSTRSPQIASPASPGDSVETLYSTPFARIVAFTAAAPNSSARRNSISSPDGGSTSSSLPWRSPTERTLAAGPTSIYKTPHGVSFLQSGNLLHPILRKSQCWCVDGGKKFILRVRADNYYRIELPTETAEEQAQLEQFEHTLDQVLQFDKTPCPFRGEFVEEASPLQCPPKTRLRTPPEQAKKWKFDRRWKPEGAAPDGLEHGEAHTLHTSEDDDTISIGSVSTRDASPQPPRSRSPITRGRSPHTRRDSGDLSIAARTNLLLRGRSITEPSSLLQLQTASLHSVPSPVVAPIEEQPELESQQPDAYDQSEAGPGDAERAPHRSEVDVEEVQGDIGPLKVAEQELAVSTQETDTGSRELARDRQDIGHTIEQRAERVVQPERPSLQQQLPDLRQATTGEESRETEAPLPDMETLSQSTSSDSFYSFADAERQASTPSIAETASIYKDPTSETLPTPTLKDTHHLSHRRNISELTVTAYTDTDSSLETPRPPLTPTNINSAPSTPPLTSSSDDSFDLPTLDVPTPPSTIRLRNLTGATQRRSFSPMPSAPTIFDSSRPKPLAVRTQAKHLTTAIVQKACTLLLSPPSHLVDIMLRIAARIAAGFGVQSYRLDRRHRHVPGSWESAVGMDEAEWESDDYGIPLQALSSRSSSTARDQSLSRSRSRARERSITREQYVGRERSVASLRGGRDSSIASLRRQDSMASLSSRGSAANLRSPDKTATATIARASPALVHRDSFRGRTRELEQD